MIYVFYRKDETDKSEAIFVRENVNLSVREFKQKYFERFKSMPSGIYNDVIAKEDKAIKKLQSQLEAYDYVILREVYDHVSLNQ